MGYVQTRAHTIKVKYDGGKAAGILSSLLKKKKREREGAVRFK